MTFLDNPISEFQIQALLALVVKAGSSILEVYHDPKLFNEVQLKSDHSPVTIADQRSNEVLVTGLQHITPHIPVISEENKLIPYDTRKNWSTFWLVDPLDGTKEFIKRNGEFTVNLGLIHKGVPILGIIQVPVTNTIYWGFNHDCFKINAQQQQAPISCNLGKTTGLVAIGSRSHTSENEAAFLSTYQIAEIKTAGSSLKFCYVAEGKADLYYREGPTMEWDTAAGHAIVTAAGGNVQGLQYNKPNLTNASFVCSGV